MRRTEDRPALLERTIKAQAAYQIAEVYAWRGDRTRPFDWLQTAYEQRDGGLTVVKVDPLDTRDRVIYVGSFNKILFPALRIAYALVPGFFKDLTLNDRIIAAACAGLGIAVDPLSNSAIAARLDWFLGSSVPLARRRAMVYASFAGSSPLRTVPNNNRQPVYPSSSARRSRGVRLNAIR